MNQAGRITVAGDDVPETALSRMTGDAADADRGISSSGDEP